MKKLSDTDITRDQALAQALKAPSKMYAWVLHDLLTELQTYRAMCRCEASERTANTQTEPVAVPDGRLVCPHCLQGDQLYSDEVSSTEYSVTLQGENGRVAVEYTGMDTRSYDEGTEYRGEIWCRNTHPSIRAMSVHLAESDLVALRPAVTGGPMPDEGETDD